MKITKFMAEKHKVVWPLIGNLQNSSFPEKSSYLEGHSEMVNGQHLEYGVQQKLNIGRNLRSAVTIKINNERNMQV